MAISEKPDVSIIMATRDRADLLPRSIASVRGQSFSNWELLVVDDASEDETPEVVRGLNDGRIIYIRNARTLGLPGARNVGLDHAVGKWVCFLDDDDEYLPAKLEIQVTRIRRGAPTVHATYCGIELFGSSRSYPPRDGSTVIDDLLSTRDVGSVAPLLVDRALAAAVRFDEDLLSEEDRDFRVRLAFESDLDAVNDVLYRVHRPPRRRLTGDPKRSLLGMESFVRKHAALIEPRSDYRLTWEMRMFQRAVGAREFARARNHLALARAAGGRGPLIHGYRIVASAGDSPLRMAYAIHCRTRSQLATLVERLGRRRSPVPSPQDSPIDN